MSYKWKIVIVAIPGTFMMMIDATIVNIALPHILAVFNDTIDKDAIYYFGLLDGDGSQCPASYLSHE